MIQRYRKVVLAFVVSLLGAAWQAEAASPEDLKNWAQWRGPNGTGEAPEGDPPTQWSEDKNIAWKTKLPGRGSSTPIVWGDSIFVQTAIAGEAPAVAAAPASQPAQGGRQRAAAPTTPHQFAVLCVDRRNGKIRWQKVAREEIPHEGHHPDHGFASHSPVTDGQHVWAYFGSRGLHCYDIQGNLKWQKDLGRMQTRNSFGEGSSPALFGNTIVVNWDHQGADFIVAFDKTTGNELWRQPRDEETTWATPLIVEYEGTAQVIAPGQKKVRSYDLKTGVQIWEAPGLTANPIPSPVAGHGMVFATSGFRGNALYAIKLGRSGDLTDTDAIAWSVKKATPYVPSPLLYGRRLYLYTGNNPILSCYDAVTGQPIIESQRLDALQGVYASPVGAAGRVYLPGRNGATLVIKQLDATDKLEVLATNTLNDRIDASPAIVGKQLFLRGHENLYCIAEAN